MNRKTIRKELAIAISLGVLSSLATLARSKKRHQVSLHQLELAFAKLRERLEHA